MASVERASVRVFIAIVVAIVGATLLVAAQTASGRKPSKPAAKPANVARTVVMVNGEPISETDLDQFFDSRQVAVARRAELREKCIDQLVDSRLVRQFLTKRNALPDKKLVEEELERIAGLARRDAKGKPPAVSESQPPAVERFAAAGFAPELLRAEVTLGLAWRIHLGRVITADRVRAYFQEHRAEFDGTQVRASQVLLMVDTSRDGDETTAAEAKLRAIRADVVAGKISFGDAARKHSQAPSAEQAGDIGWFPYRGKMPEDFSRVAFGLKRGEVSEPFRTRFGVHLVTVTDVKPGDLALEDARPAVMSRLSEEIWRQTVSELRATAKIERK